MISVEHGEYRFFSGNNIRYTDSDTTWLFEQTKIAKDLAFRMYAAAGLMRAILDTPTDVRSSQPQDFFKSMDWARDVILDVQAGKKPTPAQDEVKAFVEILAPVNGIFDATSVVATETNRPDVTAAIIDKYVPRDEAKLVIAIGHGGTLSSLATYSALQGENAFYAVRFSRHKFKDSQPVLADDEKNFLRELADGRAAIVHDEDRGLSGATTVRETIHFLNGNLGIPAIGVVPVLARHPRSLSPEIMKMDPSHNGFIYDTYGSWSDEMKTIMDELKAESAVTV